MKTIVNMNTELGWAFGVFKRDDDLYELRTSSGGGCINIYMTKNEMEELVTKLMECFE